MADQSQPQSPSSSPSSGDSTINNSSSGSSSSSSSSSIFPLEQPDPSAHPSEAICYNLSQNNVDEWIEALKVGKLLPAHTIEYLCGKVIELLMRESNIRPISSPVAVVGDVHGQFYDVLEMFKIGGECPHTNYLFLGDYVDRGYFSVETMTYLCCLKLRYPDRVTLIRGNHESRQTTLAYGFYSECTSKYGDASVWALFTNLFDYLPLAALIDDKIFATHGGLSPSLHTLDQIRVLNRFQEIPYSGPICDLMWADPDPDALGFRLSTRGASYTFGKDVLDKFMEINGLTYILRAHQLCQEGYQVLWDKFATVWSAPNYCYRMKNLAAICEVGDRCSSMFFNVYEAAPSEEREHIDKIKKPPKTQFDIDYDSHDER